MDYSELFLLIVFNYCIATTLWWINIFKRKKTGRSIRFCITTCFCVLDSTWHPKSMDRCTDLLYCSVLAV